jgi:hypothetical protein
VDLTAAWFNPGEAEPKPVGEFKEVDVIFDAQGAEKERRRPRPSHAQPQHAAPGESRPALSVAGGAHGLRLPRVPPAGARGRADHGLPLPAREGPARQAGGGLSRRRTERQPASRHARWRLPVAGVSSSARCAATNTGWW